MSTSGGWGSSSLEIDVRDRGDQIGHRDGSVCGEHLPSSRCDAVEPTEGVWRTLEVSDPGWGSCDRGNLQGGSGRGSAHRQVLQRVADHDLP